MLRAYARENRKNATLVESVLWERLRSNDFDIRFLRQHIIGDYIADLLAREQGLIIEVDGAYHAELEQHEKDEMREEKLEQMGYHIMRFSNDEVLFDTEKVML